MRNLRNQRDTMLCMISTLGIMMRISVNMRVKNGSATDDVRMGKQSHACVVTHKKRYEKEG